MTKNSAMSLYLALCGAILLFAAADAYAIITIGDIAVRSFRDEPLEASIELKTDAGEAVTLQCLSLSTPDADAGNNLPYLTDASVSLDARDGKQTVRITTTQPFGGDGFNLLLKILCPGQLQVSRDFSVLLGSRSGNVLVLPEQQQSAPTSLEESSLPAPLPKSGGFYWDIRSGETPESIAQKIYPKEPLYQKKMVRAIILANPQAFPDGQLRELSVGTVIIIPDLRSVPAVKVPGEGGGAEKGKSLRKSKPPPASRPPDKNATSKPPPLTRGSQYFLKISWQLESFPFPAFSEKPRPPTRTAPEAPNPDIAKVTELRQRLVRIDSGLDEMLSRLATASSHAGQLAQSLAQMEKTAVAAKTTPAPAQEIETRSNAYGMMPWLAAGAVVFSALLGLGAVRYYRKKSGAIASAPTEKIASSAAPDLDAEVEENLPSSAPSAANYYVLEASSQHRPKMDLLLENAGEQAGVADEQVDVELPFDPTKSLVDDVDRLVALGRSKSAISLLLDQINKHKNDRNSWLKLLMILHTGGMSSEFSKAERGFRSIFTDQVSERALTAIMNKPVAST